MENLKSIVGNLVLFAKSISIVHLSAVECDIKRTHSFKSNNTEAFDSRKVIISKFRVFLATFAFWRHLENDRYKNKAFVKVSCSNIDMVKILLQMYYSLNCPVDWWFLVEKKMSSEAACVLCNSNVDDVLQFGEKITCEDTTAHLYCLVS